MAKFILKKNISDQFYWILKSDNNGKTICKSSESYESKQGCKDSIKWTQNNAKTNQVEDLA